MMMWRAEDVVRLLRGEDVRGRFNVETKTIARWVHEKRFG